MAKITYDRFITYKKIKDLVHLINEKQKIQIVKLSDVYDTQSIKNRLDSIREFILCGVDEHWLGRLRIIQRKLKTDTISVYACKIRYGDKWNYKRNTLIEKVKGSEENYIRRFGEEEGLIQIKFAVNFLNTDYYQKNTAVHQCLLMFQQNLV